MKLKGDNFMIETIYDFQKLDGNVTEKVIQKVVDEDNAAIIHMKFTKGEGLPEHYSNSNVYMIVAKGSLTLKLGEQEPHKYEEGSILSIPYNVKMNVNNFDEDLLEMFVVKAPNPRNYKE